VTEEERLLDHYAFVPCFNRHASTEHHDRTNPHHGTQSTTDWSLHNEPPLVLFVLCPFRARWPVNAPLSLFNAHEEISLGTPYEADLNKVKQVGGGIAMQKSGGRTSGGKSD